MNKANYTGHVQQKVPLSTEGLDFIQQQILLAAEYAKAAGGNYILGGCTDNGNSVSDGTLILNGEIIEFRGGPKQSEIRIAETAESVTAAGETYENLYTRRHAEFGSNVDAADTFLWTEVKPFPTNKWLTEHYVPNTRTVNGLSLLNDITLKQPDILTKTDVYPTYTGFIVFNNYTQTGEYIISFGNVSFFHLKVVAEGGYIRQEKTSLMTEQIQVRVFSSGSWGYWKDILHYGDDLGLGLNTGWKSIIPQSGWTLHSDRASGYRFHNGNLEISVCLKSTTYMTLRNIFRFQSEDEAIIFDQYSPQNITGIAYYSTPNESDSAILISVCLNKAEKRLYLTRHNEIKTTSGISISSTDSRYTIDDQWTFFPNVIV
jgi:hypothetical protein